MAETHDANGDGRIDASDAVFDQLRVWRDLDGDGVSDAGELITLTEAGIASISLIRTDAPGTNNGHGIGFEAGFTRAAQNLLPVFLDRCSDSVLSRHACEQGSLQ